MSKATKDTRKIKFQETDMENELKVIAHNDPKAVANLRQTGKVASPTSVPLPLEDSKKQEAEMEKMPNLNASPANSINPADEMVKNAGDWGINKIGRLEDKDQNPIYRGEGLLPETKTDGYRVVRGK